MTRPDPKPDYLSIVAHYERCLARYGDTCEGVDWPNRADATTRYEVMIGVIRPPAAGRPSLLDFGCGASHLYEHLIATGREGDLSYHGLDLSPQFVALSQRKFPHLPYYCQDLLADSSALPTFDYVVANGVFTEKCTLSFEEMLAYFLDLIRTLFEKTRVGLAFNVMSTQVDWERPDLFHVPFDMMAELLVRHTSRHLVFRHDYRLYEYTVYVYR
jgi:SAM-dependent methyltransferase